MDRASGWQPEGRGFESPQLHSPESPAATVGAQEFRNHFGYHFERASQGVELLVTRRGRPYARLTPP